MGISDEHVRDDYDDDQAAAALGLDTEDWQRLTEASSTASAPEAEEGRWSRHQILTLDRLYRHRWDRDGWPIGAVKAAERLAWRLGRDTGTVTDEHVLALVDAGHLSACDEYKGHPLYDRDALDALDETVVDAVIGERAAWRKASLPGRDAAALLGWTETELARAAEAAGMTTGAEDRWARSDLATLADDDELAERIAADRLLGPDQAAVHMEIRRADLDALVDASLLAPTARVEKSVGRRSSVTVPLYRTGDLDALLEDETFDWESVRATEPGRPSPLRALAARRDRPAAVRRFAADLADRYGVETWTHYRSAGQVWEIDWAADDEDRPSAADVKALLAADPVLGRDQHVRAGSRSGTAATWARRMFRPGHAVIVDTETNGLHGELLQIAVLDAATGETLLDTLVNPGLLTWDETAQGIHGIGPADVATAPAWATLHHAFLDAVADRVIVAYNADYDRPVIRAAAARAKLDLGAAGDRKTWACAMEARTDWLETWGWLPLGGNHNALGDCQATRALLETMTRPHWAATPAHRTDHAGARL
jgi:DNA polymerase III epsilon subunit-like protein